MHYLPECVGEVGSRGPAAGTVERNFEAGAIKNMHLQCWPAKSWMSVLLSLWIEAEKEVRGYVQEIM